MVTRRATSRPCQRRPGSTRRTVPALGAAAGAGTGVLEGGGGIRGAGPLGLPGRPPAGTLRSALVEAAAASAAVGAAKGAKSQGVGDCVARVGPASDGDARPRVRMVVHPSVVASVVPSSETTPAEGGGRRGDARERVGDTKGEGDFIPSSSRKLRTSSASVSAAAVSAAAAAAVAVGPESSSRARLAGVKSGGGEEEDACRLHPDRPKNVRAGGGASCWGCPGHGSLPAGSGLPAPETEEVPVRF